jgi:dihydrofolate reductase
VQQYLAAGLIDELTISVVPILLGGGSRLLDNVGPGRLEQVGVIEAPGVAHLKYRRG